MNPSIATLICVAGIAGLFFLDRDKSIHTSPGLWLTVAWIWIIGSRSVSDWFGLTPANQSAGEGSPFDAAVFGILLILAIIVLIRRGRITVDCLKKSWPVLVYFAYCLLSVLWSDFADIAFKRWIKAIGDLAMVLVLVTDRDPIAALGRVFSRVGFILMPISVLLIRYFDKLGRGYDPDGYPIVTGVSTNKNMLGVIMFVLSLGAVWRLLATLSAKRRQHRGRHLVAEVTLLIFGIALLTMADSATSIACFALGTALILATYLPFIKRRPGRVHALVFTILLAGGILVLFGGQAGVVHALGRQTNLTGRTDIWAAVLPVVPNPLIGAGFESFWLGPRLEKVWSRLSQYMHVNEAHNGYIEVYLNLGWIGLSLIALNLISGYKDAVAAFRRNPLFGSLMLAYVAAATIYSISEAGFRMLDPIWFFLLLAVAGSRSIAFRTMGGEGPPLRGPVRRITRRSTTPEFSLEPIGGDR